MREVQLGLTEMADRLGRARLMWQRGLAAGLGDLGVVVFGGGRRFAFGIEQLAG